MLIQEQRFDWLECGCFQTQQLLSHRFVAKAFERVVREGEMLFEFELFDAGEQSLIAYAEALGGS